MSGVDPRAVVSPRARLGPGVSIGPYALVGDDVELGDGCVVHGHAALEGPSRFGRENHFYPFSSVGSAPQDRKYRGEPTRLEVGDRNVFREYVTVNRGTSAGGGLTRIGSDNLILAYSHIAHDCLLGDHNVVANGVQLGGHVVIDHGVVLGALSGIHQFVRIGESAIVGAGSMVSQDVPPFCNATGDRATLHGLNSIGLKRRGVSAAAQQALKRAYRIMFQSRLRTAEAIERVRTELAGVPEVERFVAFIESSTRGVCR